MAGAVDRDQAHRDARVVKEKQGAPPAAVVQVAADVLSAEDRLAQDAKKVVVLWLQAMQAAVVAPEAVQGQQREPPEQLARQVLRRPARWARPTAAVVRLALQRARQEQAAPQQVLQRQQFSELQEERRRERQQLRAQQQESRASRRARLAHELVASPEQARDALLVADGHVQRARAFSVQPWPLLPWLRDRLRRRPQHRRRPSNDDELFQQLRR